jgi:hypothetical protein
MHQSVEVVAGRIRAAGQFGAVDVRLIQALLDQFEDRAKPGRICHNPIMATGEPPCPCRNCGLSHLAGSDQGASCGVLASQHFMCQLGD